MYFQVVWVYEDDLVRSLFNTDLERFYARQLMSILKQLFY